MALWETWAAAIPAPSATERAVTMNARIADLLGASSLLCLDSGFYAPVVSSRFGGRSKVGRRPPTPAPRAGSRPAPRPPGHGAVHARSIGRFAASRPRPYRAWSARAYPAGCRWG